MIKLIDLLKEISNNDEIYHWTSYSSCQKIIESNKLKSNAADYFFEYDPKRILPKYKNVIFFTIDNKRFISNESSNECILVIDKSKLFKDYKVVSYKDLYEEIVLYTNDSYIPILPYLKGIILMNTLQKAKSKKLIIFLEEKNIPYQINDTLKNQTKERQSKLSILKKELINKLTKVFPNGFIGYLNNKLLPYQTEEYFTLNPIYSYPDITINKSGEFGEKNNFQITFKIKPQDYEKYINWYPLSLEYIEELINLDEDNYDGVELNLKGDIKIYKMLNNNDEVIS